MNEERRNNSSLQLEINGTGIRCQIKKIRANAELPIMPCSLIADRTEKLKSPLIHNGKKINKKVI